jgi:hypothetical protein
MLVDYHAKLDDHFRTIRKDRVGNDFPVFALEHGLTKESLKELIAELSADLLRSRTPRSPHWLLWTVCAAEIGYAYDGEEYWQSFKQQVSGWDRFGDRETIRTWFKRFSETYSGFVPQGRWAEHFSIIAWPISHSILPRDLQAQFARLLYELRYEFARQVNFGMEGVEALLRSQGGRGSSRFNHLLEQTRLLAAVVLALRDEDVSGGAHPLFPATLARIVTDISAKRTAREWLKEARRVIRNTRIETASDLKAKRPAADGARAEISLQGFGPRVVARETACGDVLLGVSVPDIDNILRLTGTPLSFLKKTRVAFYDAPDNWMPAQSLLALSNRDRAVSELPTADQPLFAFENASDPRSVNISDQLCVQTPLPWLLRRQEDGVFRQLFGKHLRPGQSYLLINSTPVADDVVRNLSLRPLNAPGNTCIYELKLEPPLTGGQRARLAEIGIGFSLRALVSPLGLMPRWEGNGNSSVWLPDEEVLLRLSADFDVTGYLVVVSAQPTIVQAEPGRDVLISAGRLPLGEHTIEVTAMVDQTAEKRSVESEIVYVQVRAPAPWGEKIESRAGFSAAVHPPETRVEDLLNGKATISLIGPENRTAVVRLCLFDANGHPSAEHDLGNLKLPVSPEAITTFLGRTLRDDLLEAALSTPWIDLVFQVEELGISRISIRQEVKPFRWKLEQRSGKSVLRLVDEAGADTPVMIDRYGIQRPDERVPLDRALCVGGIDLAHPGSLFALRLQQKQESTLACPPIAKLASLSQLGMGVGVFQEVPLGGPETITRLIGADRLWRRASPLGPLSMHRKQAVLDAIAKRIVRTVCGLSWAEQMEAILAGGFDERAVARLQRGIGGSQGFGARIRQTSWKLESSSFEGLHEIFLGFAKTYNVVQDPELCWLVLALALDVKLIKSKDAARAKQLGVMFGQIMANATLARGAFFAKFATKLALSERQGANA